MVEKISNRLRRFRTQNDLTVKQVANALSIAPSTYREWENGRKIRGETYVQLAQIFKIEVSELITGVKSHGPIVAQIAKMKRDSN